ncbi:hypothetical protein IFM89_010978 [Coptis chinensis]|uniref:Calcium uniporter protein C-terminal domain-containing protein n=1 Tax=Coptis chinensis TaxID=261450 RepID=A0A835M5C1_9MAGN|nr:hypothetical protein IFM89_010978 [Coptis chinensis]
MALRRTLSHRLLHINRAHLPFSPTSAKTTTPLSFTKPTEKNVIFGRFLQSRALVQSAMALDYCSSSPMMEKLKEMNVSKDRLRFDGLMSPTKSNYLDGISVDDAPDFDVRRFLLSKVAKAIQGVIPLPIVQPSDSRMQELENMEKEKLAIDREADALVRKELWCGLGFLVFQTAGFMRLTFWELSWDVMEPICFYVTSLYFMASYAFFLRTSQEPSFEGFFQSRFRAKQKRLMKAKKFDTERFNELRRACYPHSLDQQPASALPTCTSYNNSEGSICAMHN